MKTYPAVSHGNLEHLTALGTRLSAVLEAGLADQLLSGQSELESLLAQASAWGAGWKLLAAFRLALQDASGALYAAQRAMALLPGDAELFNLAGVVLRQLGQLDQAIAHLLHAAKLDWTLAEVHNNLGGALMLKGDVVHAVQAFEHALRLQPQNAQAWQNLGSTRLALGQHSEALLAFLRATELDPGQLQAQSLACLAMLHSADWSALERCAAPLLEGRPGSPGTPALPFVFNGLPGATRESQLRCASQFASDQYAAWLRQPPLCQRTISSGPRLRVGFLSADFHAHATSFLLVSVLEQLERSRLEVFGYSYGPRIQDAMRLRVSNACDHFRDILDLSHEQSAIQIDADRIDILIDLKGYTENARAPIMALRPAPVLVNWLGFPGSMGHRGLADYLIGDPVVTPLAHQDDYAETLALMPHCYQPTDPARQVAALPTRAQAGLPEGALVFCSFNQIFKITPPCFEAWCCILQATPGSVLWLLQANPVAMENLRQQALRLGVDSERLIFAPKLPQPEHLARLALADVALDTFPYTSHTTGSDALWMGVPLTTCMGETFGSRVAASLLTAVDMPELVAHTWDEYVALVTELAKSPQRLRALRDKLALARSTQPLFDSARFARHLEALLATIQSQQLARAPMAFQVS